jgi:hypothetical protein
MPAQRWERRQLRSTDRVVIQVSRWDALKVPIGVIRGFAAHVAPFVPDAHLVYAGPAVESVTDDPERGQVLAQAIAEYEAMPEEVAERVHLVALSMTDVEENAAIVNALQRRADVVVQKSLAEGFRLTVAEAMWKARPVVARRIGGIQDQIVHPPLTRRAGPHEPLARSADPLCLARDERSCSVGKRARDRHVQTARANFSTLMPRSATCARIDRARWSVGVEHRLVKRSRSRSAGGRHGGVVTHPEATESPPLTAVASPLSPAPCCRVPCAGGK